MSMRGASQSGYRVLSSVRVWRLTKGPGETAT
jgi:hypothetical protein